jgi:hypothetical protein
VAFTNIRSLIDCLYNVTYILEDPAERAKVYRLSGLTKLIENHKEERLRYGKDPEWDDHLSKSAARLRHTVRISGFDPDAMPTEKAKWPTMGKYLSQSHGKDNPHSQFLRIFAYGQWREYSNLSHASLEGLLVNGVHFVKDSLPHEIRPNIDAAFPQTMTMHVARAAALLICIVTELQAYCRFDGARINERVREVWSALMPVYEVRELYDGRYKALMAEKAIWLPNQT